MLFIPVPELQGEPEEISREKARLAAKEVRTDCAENVFVELFKRE